MSEHKHTGTHSKDEYAARTFESMIDSNSPEALDRWAILLDWDEAICYALVVAQKTGRKVRVIKEQGAWLAYESGQSIEASRFTSVIRY